MNVMVDIETLGRKAGCIILSIGAVTFDGKEFSVNIDPHQMKETGLFHSDPETVAWWKQQSKEAQDALTVDRVSPVEALTGFVKFFNDNRCDKFWCQGATFDPVIIDYALGVYGIPAPWKFWNVRDTRTAYDVCGFDPRSVKRSGVYHSAVDDCKHQILCLTEAFKNAHKPPL